MTRIFVIPGHGAGDSGAVGNGYQEQERVRALATRIKALGGDSVTLADFSRNYYADNGISSLSIPSDTQIIELHMDSATASARGGHVSFIRALNLINTMKLWQSSSVRSCLGAPFSFPDVRAWLIQQEQPQRDTAIA